MQNQEFKENILKLISQDKVEEAIESCMTKFDTNSIHYEQIVVISSNLRKWKSDDRKGLRPANEDLNKVRVSIIELVNDFLIFTPDVPEIQKTKPTQKKESSKVKGNHKTDYQSLIREKAKKEYPDDFEMQKYIIDQQMNAFRKLKTNRHDDIPEDVFKSIRDKAVSEYPTDFEMQEYVENQQVEAFRKIQSKKPNDITEDIWEQIRLKARREYPTDYEMQKYIEDKQVVG